MTKKKAKAAKGKRAAKKRPSRSKRPERNKAVEKKATTKAATELDGDGRERLVGTLVRAMIRMTSPLLRAHAEAIVDGRGSGKAVGAAAATLEAFTVGGKLMPARPAARADLIEDVRVAGTCSFTEPELVALRKRNDDGVSWSQLAVELGVDVTTLHALASGKIKARAPREPKAPKVAKKAKKAKAEGGKKRTRKKAAAAPAGEWPAASNGHAPAPAPAPAAAGVSDF